MGPAKHQVYWFSLTYLLSVQIENIIKTIRMKKMHAKNHILIRQPVNCASVIAPTNYNNQSFLRSMYLHMYLVRKQNKNYDPCQSVNCASPYEL